MIIWNVSKNRKKICLKEIYIQKLMAMEKKQRILEEVKWEMEKIPERGSCEKKEVKSFCS